MKQTKKTPNVQLMSSVSTDPHLTRTLTLKQGPVFSFSPSGTILYRFTVYANIDNFYMGKKSYFADRKIDVLLYSKWNL